MRQVFRKTLLPTYDVFDEDRYFEPAGGPQVLSLAGGRLGISVCEDIWNDRDFWQRRRYHSDPSQTWRRPAPPAWSISRPRPSASASSGTART